MSLAETRKGEIFAGINMFIGALTPILFILAARSVAPMYSIAIGVLISSLLFGFLCLFRKRFQELANPKSWKPLLLSTLFISILCHSFIYVGYTYTTAGNGSIVALIEILFSFLFFGLIIKTERYTSHAILGAGLMLFGIMIVLIKEGFQFHSGDFMIMAGMLFAPIGNYYQQQARKLVSSETLLFFRSVIGSALMFLLAFFISEAPSLQEIQEGMVFFLINGLMVLGVAKILWIETIHRIPVAKAATLAIVAPVGTLILGFFLLGETPNWQQLFGLPFVLAGAYFILNKEFLHISPIKLKSFD